MRSSPLSRCSLFGAAAVVLLLAMVVGGLRSRRMHQVHLQRQRERTQQAVALLFHAFEADNYLTYSALSKTMATYGDQTMHSDARIVRTPQSLSIKYISGDRSGLESGFNQRWFWRREQPSAPVEAYAEVRSGASEVATRAFRLMLENYAAEWRGRELVAGHPADIVELRPFHPAEGARGPGKRLAIDASTGLTLRVETFNYEMRPVMSSTFSEVDYTPTITAATFRPVQEIARSARTEPFLAQDMKDGAEVARRTGLLPPQPAALPPGFKLDGVGIHRCAAGRGTSYYALSRYTDGLNTLTIFAKKPAASGASSADSGPAGVHPVAARVDARDGGPIPPGTVRTCDFGPGTLVMRDTPQGRLVAVADLPKEALQRVLESTQIRDK